MMVWRATYVNKGNMSAVYAGSKVMLTRRIEEVMLKHKEFSLLRMEQIDVPRTRKALIAFLNDEVHWWEPGK